MSEIWDERYRTGDTPWDSGEPSRQLARVLAAHEIPRGPALEVGCGTGLSAIWLASQGFTVTACDVSPTAIEVARSRPGAGAVRFEVADVLAAPDLGGPFGFVFDRGVYHVLRRVGAEPYLRWLAGVTEPGAFYLTLAGNANDPSTEEGPPRVHAHELCAELQPLWDLVELREFVYHGIHIEGRNVRPLGWSALFRRAARRE
jgi:SAM-dependent methyltransferase